MKKTLYINDTRNYQIKIDGPSLLVSRNNYAPRRIPYEYLDFVCIDYKVQPSQEMIKDFLRFKKPAVITNLYKNDSLHLLPISESGYFNEIPQRLAVNRRIIRSAVHRFLIEKKRIIQILAIKSFDRNLSKALKNHNYTNDEYFYYLMKFCRNEKKKFFNTRRKFTDLFLGLINAKCIEQELNPEVGIINDKKRLGFAYDILMVIDPIMDVLTAKMLNYKNYKIFYNGNWLNDIGFKTVIALFEKGKPIFSKLLEKYLKEIKQIITKAENEG